jgi:hypothetical protein
MVVVSRVLAVAGLLAATTACAPAARLMLFSSTPAFVLDAEQTADGVQLVASGLEPEDFEDDLCTAQEKEDEGCEDDWFVGVAFYRADDGAYGTYVETTRIDVTEWLDPEPPTEGTVWRAGVLREEDGDDVRVHKVSIAAFPP